MRLALLTTHGGAANDNTLSKACAGLLVTTSRCCDLSPYAKARIMRYELTDREWTAIKPMLPNKPRGIPRVNDRRVLNGIFWVLRSGAPWRDLPKAFGPYTTCYNRFVRWRRAGVWGRIMNALAAAHDAAVQMIDTSIVRVHQHGACITRNRRQSMGRSRGGLTSKIHAVVDTNGLESGSD
jgi:transposase